MLKVLFILLLTVNTVYGQVKPDSVWMNQKFSMFIHWGLYSQLGGVWNEKAVTQGYSEQIQSHAGIFSDWYAEVARGFNPGKWNADSVVLLAKKAGMKSIVFTSKHHDGFCMYHSRYTDFNIADATPFKRDVMKELSEACQRHGVRFAVYFSLIDWHFPQAYPISSHNADPLTPEHYAYNLKQVEEIMSNYGPVSEIWFDMGSLTPEQSRGLYELVNRLQPNCMISGRLGNDCSDFSVMADNEYPDYKIGVPWQTAASFFDETWGYRAWQERGSATDKANEKILSLIKVISRGGNYLLNIGPKGDGSVVPFEAEVLEKIGRWLQIYGEAVYGTKTNPFDKAFAWGDVTAKDNTLYLFVEKNKRPEVIELEGLKGKVVAASYIGGKQLDVRQGRKGWEILLADEIKTEGPVGVIRVDLKSGWQVIPVHSLVRGKILTPENAVPLYAYSSIDYYTGFQSTIAYSWYWKTGKSDCSPVIRYTDNEKGKQVLLEIDGREQKVILEGGARGVETCSPVRWGKVYTKPSGSVFGAIPEVKETDRAGWLREGWTEEPEFRQGEKREIAVPERRSLLLMQDIESDKDQEIPVYIGSGNGVQVILNGKVLTMHTSTRGETYNRELVVLPLKKGKNRLLLKFYNRFENVLCYSITPATETQIYRLSLTPVQLGKKDVHRCVLRLAEPPARNTAMRLNNVKIELK